MSSDWWSRKLNNIPQPQPQQRQSLPVQAPIRFPNVTTPQRQHVADTNLPPNTEINVGDAIRMWKGGEGTHRDGYSSCPSCGSHLMFSRVKGGIAGKAPAPRCFSCGYNGVYDQGDQANWAV